MSNAARKIMPLLPIEKAVIRPLTAADSEAYRLLRQKILEAGDGKYFSDSYVRESHFSTKKHWQEWCTETNEHCTIGTFVNEELVGIMGIVMYGPSRDLTVEWEVTWLDPRYRRYGLAKLAYEKVREWSVDHGYKRAVVFIREDNLRSQDIRKKQGATYTHTKYNETWADGSVANVRCFMLDFAQSIPKQHLPYSDALSHLTSVLADFSDQSEENAVSLHLTGTVQKTA